MSAVLSGIGLGFGVAAGFGPINVLCLTTGLRAGFAPALGVGVGAAVVDGLYAFLAATGVAALLTDGLLGWFQVVGGAVLVVIGVKLMVSARSAADAVAAAPTFGRALLLSLAATVTNPLTIVSWAAAFAGIVPALHLARVDAMTLLPLAVAAGTMTWFLIVAAAASFARTLARESILRVVSFVGGGVIAVLGVVLALDGTREI